MYLKKRDCGSDLFERADRDMRHMPRLMAFLQPEENCLAAPTRNADAGSNQLSRCERPALAGLVGLSTAGWLAGCELNGIDGSDNSVCNTVARERLSRTLFEHVWTIWGA